MHACMACAHLGNAGQGLLPSRPQGQALLALIRVGLRPEGLRARRPQPASMRHENRYGFRKQYFSDTTLGPDSVESKDDITNWTTDYIKSNKSAQTIPPGAANSVLDSLAAVPLVYPQTLIRKGRTYDKVICG